jgi:predicted Holliday junction resolvase-like endonuclease
MDILSFILGISIVVVIAVAVVAVIAFVKVNRLNKEIESIHTIYSGEFERVNRDRTDSERQIYSVLDSRLDKLESKITNSRKA